ncbi:MAG TPA: CDP-diacylglycerol--glycerol-3-phosphate 3-phosphatidyltransferase [Papillibacter sp.]|jgi:CDP-diacylglycerol--glycerol-3-phosphate 3-phosphatidyltransferase|nr:CDP-diacylglycerol--glycerol-3-phosphate 3-phosphatidyltransferase [Papillibacter sp.]
MNTANKLTMLRLLMIPVFLIVLYLGFEGSTYVALGIFILASITDFADGHIARSRGMITDFGKFMDPLADKVLVMAALLWFTERGLIPAWATLIVLVREFAVTALRLLAVDSGRVIAAGLSGKIKTVLTILGIAVLFLPVGETVVMVCVWMIVLITVFSGAEYFVKNKDVISWTK